MLLIVKMECVVLCLHQRLLSLDIQAEAFGVNFENKKVE